MSNYKKICIIDDDAIAVFGLKRGLQSMKSIPDPLIYENGLQAIEGFKKMIEEDAELPTFILLDINMPVMGGWDFISQMNEIWPKDKEKPTIYMMTSSISDQDVEQARTFNLEKNYLIKPVFAETLVRILLP
ncbi:response regulator [Zobellia uliginosa]|uniref:response regulator n=1 Tax=Zobellia uliginosa TaxID=143224 RepID=UPI0026E3FF13|nr:response regulator [Zobellia uliginosa]MDO6515884.1 response regulator [Zobellia uliginosa]